MRELLPERPLAESGGRCALRSSRQESDTVIRTAFPCRRCADVDCKGKTV